MDKVKLAQEAGKAAFAEGKDRMPMQDRKVRELIGGGAESGPILRAWLKGWDLANVNAL